MASQKEIAARTGVSQSLVSRVLNGRANEFGIANETATRVLTVAAELGYQPNPAASMLLGGASKLVGVVVRSFDDPLLAAILQELNRRALAAGCTLLVSGFEGDEAQRKEQFRHVQRYRPDALIVVGTTDFRGWGQDAFREGQRVVQIGLSTGDRRVITCGIDEAAAAMEVVRHLGEVGHRQIAVLGDNTLVSTERVRLIADACRNAPLPISVGASFLGTESDQQAGAEGARWWCERKAATGWPTAVIATGDLVALGFVHALGKKGVRVPDALAVASYDDIPIAGLVHPSLTTIRQPARELAAAAMEIALGGAPAANVRLRGELVMRESTRKPAHVG